METQTNTGVAPPTPPKKENRSFFLYSPSGGGKTTLAGTIPGKMGADFFDPGGSHTLGWRKDLVHAEEWLPTEPSIAAVALAKGGTVKDQESIKSTMDTYQRFTLDFERRYREGFFDEIDVYLLDSATTLELMVLDRCMYLTGRGGEIPQMQDYMATMITMQKIVRMISALPCHVVFTAHEDSRQDEVSGKITIEPLLTGKSKARIPLVFSEVLHLEAKGTMVGKTPKFYAQTAPGGFYTTARTRMGAGGKLNGLEEVTINWALDPTTQGLAAMAKKCGVTL